MLAAAPISTVFLTTGHLCFACLIPFDVSNAQLVAPFFLGAFDEIGGIVPSFPA